MAFLPFLPYCSPVPAMGKSQKGEREGGKFLYLWEMPVKKEDCGFLSPLCQTTIKILAIQWVEEEMSKHKKDETSKQGSSGRSSIWPFCPLSSSRLENVLLPSHSVLHLMVVDFSPSRPLLLPCLSVPECGF